MKSNYLLRFLVSLCLIFPFVGNQIWAQLAELEVGAVYHFTNARYTNYAMTVNSAVKGVTPVNKEDHMQLWMVTEKNSDGQYRLRNLGDGGYLKGNGQNGEWTLVYDHNDKSNDTYFELGTSGNYNILRCVKYTGGYGYANLAYEKSCKILGWSYNGDLGSQWTIEKQAIDAETLNKALDNLLRTNTATLYFAKSALSNLFEDASCTTPKKTLTAEALAADADYQSLPPTLQTMTRKVYQDAWTEANYDAGKSQWDSNYAKKYRVQLYEPYSEPEACAKAMRFNAHTNLNNPTGIFMNSDDIAFVFVEGEIKDGATLYLSSFAGHSRLGGYNSGVELQTGLNVITGNVDNSNLCINYVVHTFDATKGTGKNAIVEGRELSKYPDLKIHIEGGYINGYWNKMGDELYTADTDEDWDYIKARATQTDVIVLGEHVTLQFPLLDADTEGNVGMANYFNTHKEETTSLERTTTEWDRVMLWERLLMGMLDKETIQKEAKKSPYSEKDYVIEYTGDDTQDNYGSDYSEYYRLHGLAFGVGGGSYMYGSWDYCGYHYNTMYSIMVQMAKDGVEGAGVHWGPAHEIGHQHQGPIRMRGETEVTNNLFSNVVLWYVGETTSRVNDADGSLQSVLKNFNSDSGHYLTNNIWANTQMYYKLFLYYHVLGHNPKFYPRLFEMMRQNPEDGLGAIVDGNKAQLHLYKTVCEAAGEDLTEFFRAYGFFKPLDGFTAGDYGNSVYFMTQEQIDAAIAEVKAKQYPENIAMLFINDATGETILSHKGDNLEPYSNSISAEMGCYANYTKNNATAASNAYTYYLSGNKVTVSGGTGGVGFAIYDENNELIGFSDRKTFEISDECARSIALGKARFVVTNADNTTIAATNMVDTDNTEANYQILGELLTTVESIVSLIDESGTKVGYYHSTASSQNLKTSYEKAKAVYEQQESSNYLIVYDDLTLVYLAFKENMPTCVGIVEGNAYQLTNKAYTDRSMCVSDENKMYANATQATDAFRWYFETSSTPGRYFLKNKSTSLYPGNVTSGAELSANKTSTTGDDAAYAYELRDMGNGYWSLVGATGLHCSSSQSYAIVGWGTGSVATQWTITAVEVDEVQQKKADVLRLVELTKGQINDMADALLPGKLPMQTADASKAFYLSTNACYNTLNNAADGQGLDGLLDETTATYFHSDYTNKVDGSHYLQVDLGESNQLSKFKFNYATRSNGNNCPTEINVTGSADGTNFSTQLGTYKSNDATNPLPTEFSTWESGEISIADGCRYLRFTVTSSETTPYFVMSTFGVEQNLFKLSSVNAEYAEIDGAESALNTAGEKLVAAIEACNNTSATADELETVKSDLESAYDTLLQICENIAQESLTAKRDELKQLVENTNTLIDQCGEVNLITSDLTLSATAGEENYYLTGGPSAPSQGSIANLLDGNLDSQYTSNWGRQTQAPYLQVQMPAEKGVSQFGFTFTSRNEGNGPTPTKIEVSGSNDGTNFTPIQTFTDAEYNFPEAANGTSGNAVKWTSPIINAASNYTYLRFTVTESDRSGGGEQDANGFYHFGISEFGMSIVDGCVVTADDNVGIVSDGMLLSTYEETNQANTTCDMATTEYQLEKAIARLTDVYTVLEYASTSEDLPTRGNFYRICHKVDDVKYYVQAQASGVNDKENAMKLTTDQASASIFYLQDVEGATKLLSYSTGRYVMEDESHRGLQNYGVAGGEVTFGIRNASSIPALTISAPHPLCVNSATADDATLYYLDNSTKVSGAANDFLLEKVAALPVRVSDAGYASFYTPVALTLPDGLEAYYIAEDNVENGYVVLSPIQGAIPANTGVMLKNVGNYNLNIATAATPAIGDNILKGSAASEYIKAMDGTSYYVLSKQGEDVGLFRAMINKTEAGETDNENGTHFLNNGFKAYLPLTTKSSVKGFHFVIGETTGIATITPAIEANAPVYDLSGRRVMNLVKGGIYIQNGKKFIVK